jgi:DNA (cytosine-5)-methyltransferase 1
LVASADAVPIHWSEPRRLTGIECVRLQTFPDDYNFLNQPANYVCGMSVPPFMMQRVALEIYRQFFTPEAADG